MKMKSIKLTTGAIGLALFALGVANGCSGSKNDGASQRQTTQTLYNKYGGKTGVMKINDDAAAILIADCVENPYFTMIVNFDNQDVDGQGHGANGHDTADRLLSCLDAQLTTAMGGPATYLGTAAASAPSRSNPSQTYNCADMTTIHNGLGIPAGVFDQFVSDFGQALKKNGVSDADATRLATALVGLKTTVVAPEGEQQNFNYQPGQPSMPPGYSCSVAAGASPGPSASPSASPSGMPEMPGMPM
jgi:hypothetical protein